MARTKITPIRLSDDTLERIDAVRGSLTRSDFVRAAVERMLDDPSIGDPGTTASRSSPRKRTGAVAAMAKAQAECRHPIGRRLGGMCMECGRKMGG